MNHVGRSVGIGRSLSALAAAAAAAGIVVLLLKGRTDLLVELFVLQMGAFAIGLGVLVWVVLPSQHRNAAVWILGWTSWMLALYAMSPGVFVLVAPEPFASMNLGQLSTVAPADLPLGTALAIYLGLWGWIPGLLPFLTVGVLLFPDGKLPSPRWRWLAWSSLSLIAVAAVGAAWLTRPSSTEPLDQLDVGYGGWLGETVTVATTLVFVCVALSAVSVIVRYRRSSTEVRAQIRWIALGAVFVTFIAILSIVSEDETERSSGSSILSWVMFAGMMLLVASIFVAITKYRLYDINVVISKAVTYVSLAVVLTLLYGTAVVLYIQAFADPQQRETGDLGITLPIGATVLVAIAFEPVRIRMQRVANRLVYGRRAAPHEVLSQLTSRLTDTSAGDSLDGLAELLRGGTAADVAAVWLRVGERLRPEAASPSDALAGLAPTDLEPARTESELRVLVRHGDRVLGALSITKPPVLPVTPADVALVEDLASATGLVLRNRQLNADLAARADQLQSSRRRLIAAHDAARHRLERDLHDGAQQQVVALKVKLGLATSIAKREGAEDLANRVEGLADETQVAVDAMRAVAHGIYPPLLEAEGLGPALRAVSRSAHVPVDVELAELPRYGREIEESVYFCVVSALHAAEMAGATRAWVDVTNGASELHVMVSYDAVGQALTMLADRMDAFGGQVATSHEADATTYALTLPAEVSA